MRIMRADPFDGLPDGIGRPAVARQRVGAFLRRHGSDGDDSFWSNGYIAIDSARSENQKLHADAVIPRYAHGPEEDAGMDLHAVEAVTLAPGETNWFRRVSPSNCPRATRRRSGPAAAWR